MSLYKPYISVLFYIHYYFIIVENNFHYSNYIKIDLFPSTFQYRSKSPVTKKLRLSDHNIFYIPTTVRIAFIPQNIFRSTEMSGILYNTCSTATENT